LGTEIRANAEVTDVDMLAGKLVLKSREIITGDVIVGADGESLTVMRCYQERTPPG
jgi:flavin-dependent dehydrogenase